VLAMESGIPEITNDNTLELEQAIVTDPIQDDVWNELGWIHGGMLWTCDKNYSSVRKIGKRLFICNGLPLQATEEALTKHREELIELLYTFFPSLRKNGLTISHSWTGLLLYATDNQPHIIQKDGYYEIFGLGGNGLTNGTMCGKLLAESLARNE